MRVAGFGLVGLLVVCGIYAIFFNKVEAPRIQKAQEAKKQVEPLTGRGPDGRPAAETIDIDPVLRGGQPHGLKVTSVTSGGYFDTFYQLQKDDVVVQIGETNVDSLGDPETAKSMLYTPAQYQKLVIERAGQKVTLTATGGGVGSGAPGTVKIPLH